MSNSLSNLVDKLLYKNGCEDKSLQYDSPSCNKNYEKEFDQELVKRIANTCTFCKEDINRFGLMLRKVVYPYEYMNDW